MPTCRSCEFWIDCDGGLLGVDRWVLVGIVPRPLGRGSASRSTVLRDGGCVHVRSTAAGWRARTVCGLVPATVVDAWIHARHGLQAGSCGEVARLVDEAP